VQILAAGRSVRVQNRRRAHRLQPARDPVALIDFFLLGIHLLTRVDLDKDRREAHAGEEPAAQTA